MGFPVKQLVERAQRQFSVPLSTDTYSEARVKQRQEGGTALGPYLSPMPTVHAIQAISVLT